MVGQPRLPQHFHDNHTVYLRQLAVLVIDVQPADDVLIVEELKPKVVLAGQREPFLNVRQVHLVHRLAWNREHIVSHVRSLVVCAL